MKNKITVILIIFNILNTSIAMAKDGPKSSASSTSGSGTGAKAAKDITRVQGSEKKDGTTSPSYLRSSPDGTKNNNWSTKGNTNPATGSKGTK